MKLALLPIAFLAISFSACAMNDTQLSDQSRSERPQGGSSSEARADRSPPDFSDAATKLGVSETDLQNAMRGAGGPRADLAEVAKTLGVTEDALRDALPPPPQRRR